MKREEFQGKHVLVLGFGREGQDTLMFLRKHTTEKDIAVADQKERNQLSREARAVLGKTRYLGGRDYLKSLSSFEVVVKSPGIPLHAISSFLTKNVLLTSQTNIFLVKYPGTVVGVTGTKGKSTTASLIAHVLQKAGKNAKLAGNIGEPVLAYLDQAKSDDVFVYELSSYQLETVHKSPHIAVLLNIYPEHLDHHKTFQKYIQAKQNITKFQTEKDYLIFNKKDERVRGIAEKSRAQSVGFIPKPRKDLPFLASPEPVTRVAKLFGISPEITEKALKSFKPLPHRLEKVGKWRGIEFINDSLATIPQATAAALDAFGSDVSVLIAGGVDRGVSYTPLAEAIAKHKIQTLVLFPSSGQKIAKELKALKKSHAPAIFFVESMKEAVALCYRHARKGSVCLLSPASPSFNMFRDYQDRGEQFTAYARSYGEKA
ncbi:MAG: UDP-N-acetylmuramoyl-L-alanine--D-glutamate ligase [Candidatus Yanofskybacteria bacterium]|nr:UDP-N-acetylmuramoyl-L-alanine--D-glutamate ligase [Candidatus Yanofskybacteria bacterium]